MLVLGLAAVVLAARRPIVSGVLLGLAMMKPQIAAPFFLWMMFTRRWNVAAVALAVIGGGIAVFCAGAAANPVSVAGQYVAVLRTYYTGNQAMAGEAQLHPLLIHMFQGPFGDLVAGGVAAALLAVIFNEARLSAGRVQLLYAAPALVAVWSLLTFYHLTYGFVLLLPVTALLLLGHVGHQRLRPAVMWTLQIALMADVPGIWRRASLRLPRLEWADAIFLNFDRALMVFLFVGLVALRRNLSQFNDAGSDAL
jgi:hypothetical protein